MSNVHIEKMVKLITDIRDEHKTGRFVVTIDASKGGIANMEIGRGERVPQGASVLLTKNGSFVVVPDDE